MSFTVVKSEGDRKALIDQYLKNRETLKNRVMQEKVGKQAFQRDVASELQKPVVEQQKKLEEERQKKTDERQNALLAKLQENQEAITEKLDDQEKAMLQNLLLQQQLMQSQQPALAPPGVAASLQATTPTTPRRPRVDLNPDIGIDPSILQELELQPISSLMNAQVKDLEAIHRQIQTPLKRLGAQSRGSQFTEEKRRQLDSLKKYNSSLKLLIQGKKMSIVPNTGQGIRTVKPQSKNPYKLTDEGMFGNLQIDPQKLLDLKVEAYRDGKKVLSRKADQDLIELLTKRYNTKKVYSEKALRTFAKLIDLSGLPVNPRSKKYTSTQKPASVGGVVRYFNSPDELIERLYLLIGSKQGGKVSVRIDNEIAGILDRLREDGHISKKDYLQIYENYVE